MEMFLRPYVVMDVPFAADKRDSGRSFFFCSGEAGKTDTSAPLSTRNWRRNRRQKIERAPSRDEDDVEEGGDGVETEEIVGEKPGAVTGPRPCRFPKQAGQKRMKMAVE